ncbi:MAG TPA: hypothetical protein VGI96_24765 [Streptosporangiaceae bacterium]
MRGGLSGTFRSIATSACSFECRSERGSTTSTARSSTSPAEAALGTRLKRYGITSLAYRSAALMELATRMPPALVNRLLGISIATISTWSGRSPSAAYAAEVARRGRQ